MSLLAAFNVVMARHSGSRDIVLATPIATRSPRELEQLIGCFLNMLTLRTDLSGDPTFGELVARVKDTCLDAYAHQSLPFERLVLETSPTRSRSHQPIAQVAFSLQNTPVSQLELPGLQVQFHKLDTGRARMDLSVWITESPDGLVGELEYDTELFDPSWVRMLGDDLIRTIQAVTADPDVALSTVPAADPHTLRSLLHTWNDTDVDFGTEHLIHRIFEQQARRTPDATAVLSGSESITYGELDADANRLARRLSRAAA